MLLGKSLCSFGDEIHMRAFTEHLTRGADGIGNVLDASHAAGAECGAIHDESIELDLAYAIKEAAAAGVESVVVFHDDHGFFRRVERGAAVFENAPSFIDGFANTVEVGFH